jgi:hypothetical protein
MSAPTITVDNATGEWTINWPEPKPRTFEMTPEALESMVADRNKAHGVRRRALNSRTIDGEDVTVNDGIGGHISGAGNLLHYLLGREPLEWDEDRDDDLPFEEWLDEAVDA